MLPYFLKAFYWKRNFSLGPHVRWSVGWSEGRSVIITLHFHAPIGSLVLVYNIILFEFFKYELNLYNRYVLTFPRLGRPSCPSRFPCLGLKLKNRVFIKYCVFSWNFVIFLNSASSGAVLVFYLPGECKHTDTEGKQRNTRVRNILKSLEKNQY